jgi:hypothetical protein
MAKEEVKVVDLTEKVKVKTTDKAPHHEKDQVIEVSPLLAEKMLKQGWATAIK